MKFLKFLFILIILPLFAFNTAHKYYISVSQINHIPEKKSIQITSRIFIDDFENLLRERYDDAIVLDDKNELTSTNDYIERYLKEKIVVKINGETVHLKYIGKEYDVDIVRCYLEVENVETIKSFEVSNELLFDLFEEQQNIVKTKINGKQKSFLLTQQNHKALLKFN
ncbi:DUF6702 family protein [Changchengzhania lutea]|uniref:DUF6702 family protein n=1 Tax=Changchengzhania lutea TaxID=2049305 RepID=UPI00115C7E15|nr:DUF6702 family protein [Changchengzhania lutea]